MNNTAQTVYRIRNAEGEFSKGGSSPYFSKTGKFWKYGPLKSHLALVTSCFTRYAHSKVKLHPYVGCKIVRYELQEAEAIDVIV